MAYVDPFFKKRVKKKKNRVENNYKQAFPSVFYDSKGSLRYFLNSGKRLNTESLRREYKAHAARQECKERQGPQRTSGTVARAKVSRPVC